MQYWSLGPGSCWVWRVVAFGLSPTFSGPLGMSSYTSALRSSWSSRRLPRQIDLCHPRPRCCESDPSITAKIHERHAFDPRRPSPPHASLRVVEVRLLGAAWDFHAEGGASRSRRCRPSEGHDSNREGNRLGEIPVYHDAPVRRYSHLGQLPWFSRD